MFKNIVDFVYEKFLLQLRLDMELSSYDLLINWENLPSIG